MLRTPLDLSWNGRLHQANYELCLTGGDKIGRRADFASEMITMNASSVARSQGWPQWFLLAICFLPLADGPVAAAPPPAATSHASTGISAPLASTWFDKAYSQFVSFLGSKDRMLQFGAVGMALGLFIIWYRRP